MTTQARLGAKLVMTCEKNIEQSDEDTNIMNAAEEEFESDGSMGGKDGQPEQSVQTCVTDSSCHAFSPPSGELQSFPPRSSLLSSGADSMSSCHVTPHREDCLRRKLKFFFMDPLEKWRARRQFPWKLSLQVFKIIVVTIQLVMFGSSRFSHVLFVEDNTFAFQHLFLDGWDAVREVNAYPPATGRFAIYNINKFFVSLDFTIKNFHDIKRTAIGSYDFETSTGDHSLRFCRKLYMKGKLWPSNSSYDYDSHTVTKCVEIIPAKYLSGGKILPSREILKSLHVNVTFDRLINATLEFSLKTVHLKALEPFDSPDCYRFNITILFDNSGNNGQLAVNLIAKETKLECHGNIQYLEEDKIGKTLSTILNGAVIAVGIASGILCTRALFRAQKLRRETEKFFKMTYDKDLNTSDKLDFLNLWYVTIVTNDILIILGSALKIRIEQKDFEEYDVVGVFLGTANLLVWIGVLRYLGLFPKYNILIITLKKCLPNVLRFCLCALLIYAGFTICGWVVLGPYHMKFRTLSQSSECLFSLINGDDMFATFAELNSSSGSLMWYYSRIYLYTFISLFIYVVLSCFIAVIMDTYETIKQYYEHGFPQSDLHDFISQCQHPPHSGLYRKRHLSGDENNWLSWIRTCCLPCWDWGKESERTPLLTSTPNTPRNNSTSMPINS